MLKLLTTGFWKAVARLILRNKITIILLVLSGTILLRIPVEKHEIYLYSKLTYFQMTMRLILLIITFWEIFGEEGNLVILGVKDKALFEAKTF